MRGSGLMAATVAAVVGMMGYLATAQHPATRPHAKAAQSQPTTYKAHFGHLPLPVDQTIEKENSAQDKLQVDVTHSAIEAGKHVAYVRVVWGDLNNLIKHGGKQYYSDWDGSVTLDKATGEVVHRIAFDEYGHATTRPAHRIHDGATSRPAHSPRHSASTEPGPGSGRDELITASGAKIEWKAGVVGALDGLTIKITSDSPTITGTIKAGNFTVPLNVSPAPTSQP